MWFQYPKKVWQTLLENYVAQSPKNCRPSTWLWLPNFEDSVQLQCPVNHDQEMRHRTADKLGEAGM